MRITEFDKGIAPRIEPSRLPPGFAQTAENCDLRGGNISAALGTSSVLALGSSTAWETLYKFDDKYLYWDSKVNVAEGPPYQSDRRIFYTGDGTPKQLAYSDKTGNGKPTSSEYRELGIAAPNVRPEAYSYFSWSQYEEWVTGTDYEEGDYVKQTADIVNMKCIVAHTSSDIASDDWSAIWAYFSQYFRISGDTGGSTWVKDHAYSVGDIVSVPFTLPFQCKAGHRSSTDDKPGVGANWTAYWMYQPFESYIETVSYVFTYVNDRGEESAPSLPTPDEDLYKGKAVLLWGFKDSEEKGTVEVSAGSLDTVTGTDTNFTERFSSGDRIIVGDPQSTGQMRTVSTVTNDTTLTVTQDFDSAFSSGTEYSMLPQYLSYFRVYRLTAGEYGAEYQYVPFYYKPETWATGKRYLVDNYVKKGSSAPYTIYKCILEHVSTSADEPGVGANWETYWSLTERTQFVENDNGMPLTAWPMEYWDASFESDLSDIVIPYSVNSVLGEVLPTEGMIPPPSNLEGIVRISPGVLAGYVNNEVYLSEPQMPYAWPLKYMIKVSSNIRALGVSGQSLIAMTERGMAILTGTPGNMSSREFPSPLTVQADTSVVPTKKGTFYASNNGLCLLTETSVNLLTKQYFTKEQWAALNPEDFICELYDGKYIAGSSSSNILYMFNILGDEPLSPTTLKLTSGTTIKSMAIDFENDALYLLTEASGDYNIVQFNVGSALTFTWKSPLIRSQSYDNLSCARILGGQSSGTPVTFTFWADGTQIFSGAIEDESVFNLPSGVLENNFEVQVSGTTDVNEIFLGHDSDEVFG